MADEVIRYLGRGGSDEPFGCIWLGQLEDLYGSIMTGEQIELAEEDLSLAPVQVIQPPSSILKKPLSEATKTKASDDTGMAENTCIYLSELAWWVSEDDVKDALGAQVVPDRTVFLENKANGKSRGIAIVQFFDRSTCDKAFSIFAAQYRALASLLEPQVFGREFGGAKPKVSYANKASIPSPTVDLLAEKGSRRAVLAANQQQAQPRVALPLPPFNFTFAPPAAANAAIPKSMHPHTAERPAPQAASRKDSEREKARHRAGERERERGRARDRDRDRDRERNREREKERERARERKRDRGAESNSHRPRDRDQTRDKAEKEKEKAVEGERKRRREHDGKRPADAEPRRSSEAEKTKSTESRQSSERRPSDHQGRADQNKSSSRRSPQDSRPSKHAKPDRGTTPSSTKIMKPGDVLESYQGKKARSPSPPKDHRVVRIVRRL